MAVVAATSVSPGRDSRGMPMRTVAPWGRLDSSETYTGGTVPETASQVGRRLAPCPQGLYACDSAEGGGAGHELGGEDHLLVAVLGIAGLVEEQLRGACGRGCWRGWRTEVSGTAAAAAKSMSS